MLIEVNWCKFTVAGSLYGCNNSYSLVFWQGKTEGSKLLQIMLTKKGFLSKSLQTNRLRKVFIFFENILTHLLVYVFLTKNWWHKNLEIILKEGRIPVYKSTNKRVIQINGSIFFWKILTRLLVYVFWQKKLIAQKFRNYS